MAALRFTPFDSGEDIHKTHGALPHWSQEGATHFITFRQQDSLPAGVMEKWHKERREWLELRGESPEAEGWFERLAPDHRREYGMKFGKAIESIVDRGAGSCLLRKADNAAIVKSALEFFDSERYQLGDFVIMPNHVHLLVIPAPGRRIGAILQSWKSYTAKAINAREGLEGQFWQRESFDHIVRTRRQLDRLREYIADNPVSAKLREGDYIWRPAEWEESS